MSESDIPDLTFLDPDLYVSEAAVKGQTPLDLEAEFVCVICCGVVLDPVECKQCSSLYCKGCLQHKLTNNPCPKRCGGTEFSKVNRLIMNALNKLPFKCQHAPKCDKFIPYDQYISHYKSCEAGKPKQCPDPDCQMIVRNLKS
jgi:hypothetical protein